jgi:hypothetical protein
VEPDKPINVDPKLMCGGGFGLPEVKRFLREELRNSVTAVEIRKLPSLDSQPYRPPLKPTSGLVEYYRLLMKHYGS